MPVLWIPWKWPLHVPPLRDRREDIPLLVDLFVRRLRDRTDRDVGGLTPEAMARLVQHDWPGNVRELRSALEYAFVVCPTGLIDLSHLPPLAVGNGMASPASPALSRAASGSSLSVAEQTQRDQLIGALRANNGNKSAAARDLDVTRVTVFNRMRKYGIDLQRVLVL